MSRVSAPPIMADEDRVAANSFERDESSPSRNIRCMWVDNVSIIFVPSSIRQEMTYGNGVCKSRLLSLPPPSLSSLPVPLPASEIESMLEFEIEFPNTNPGSSCIPPRRLPNSSAALLEPIPMLRAALLASALDRIGKLLLNIILLAPILAKPLDCVEPTELIAEPTLRGRGVRASMSSTSGLPLPRRGWRECGNGCSSSLRECRFERCNRIFIDECKAVGS
jgi:hypothetical protein